MKRAYWFYLPATLAIGVSATWGPFGPQVVVLCLTVGIFLGTVSLRGPRAGERAPAQTPVRTAGTQTTHQGV